MKTVENAQIAPNETARETGADQGLMIRLARMSGSFRNGVLALGALAIAACGPEPTEVEVDECGTEEVDKAKVPGITVTDLQQSGRRITAKFTVDAPVSNETCQLPLVVSAKGNVWSARAERNPMRPAVTLPGSIIVSETHSGEGNGEPVEYLFEAALPSDADSATLVFFVVTDARGQSVVMPPMDLANPNPDSEGN